MSFLTMTLSPPTNSGVNSYLTTVESLPVYSMTSTTIAPLSITL